MLKNVIIVDIDGTIADNRHRAHFVEVDTSVNDVTRGHCGVDEEAEAFTDHGYGDVWNNVMWWKCLGCEADYNGVHKPTCEHFREVTKPNWDAFFHPDRVMADKPIRAVRDVVFGAQAIGAKYESLGFAGNEIYFCTARMEKHRSVTHLWLLNYDLQYDHLLMRRDADFRPDYEVKEEMLKQIGPERVLFAIEDNKGCVDMYRRNGVFVFDVGAR